MLEYAKIVLPNVSSNRNLFRKELFKCLNWLDKTEITEFISWCRAQFNDQYPDILAEAFSGTAA